MAWWLAPETIGRAWPASRKNPDQPKHRAKLVDKNGGQPPQRIDRRASVKTLDNKLHDDG